MEKFTVARTIDDFVLKKFENRDDHVTALIVQDIERELANEIMKLIPLEGGEKIISLSEIKTEHQIDMMQTEMRQSMHVEDLVRCKDCEKLGMFQCPVGVRNIDTGNFYCAAGVRYERFEEEDG